MTSPLIVALDLDLDSALSLTKNLNPEDCQLKIGHQLFTSAGPDSIKVFQDLGFKVFLDLKFHDIPNTVFSAVSSAIDLGVWMLNIHASGGSEMIQAAVLAKEESKNKKILIIGVTILTSLNDSLLRKIGLAKKVNDTVGNLALLSQANGLDGVVCSPKEAREIKNKCGNNFLTITPGIRLIDSAGDQKRFNSPKEAILNGADYIVVGRSITRSSNPVKSISEILNKINL